MGLTPALETPALERSILHELPSLLLCLEGARVFTSQKEARHWQRHWLVTGKDRWVGLAEHQEGRQKGGAHCLDMDKLVRRAT